MCILFYKRQFILKVIFEKKIGVSQKTQSSFFISCRADYWKSNEKKYCDFCKCWIADNKISVSLHENGKRHKECVAKRISEINKKSTKDHKEKIKVDEEMSKMEKNAMAAYLKDIESNGDITSQIINEKLSEANRLKDEPSTVASSSISVTTVQQNKKKTKWQEAKSEDGNIYYWNIETNDAVWEPPPEGFVSLADLEVKKKSFNDKPKSESIKRPNKPCDKNPKKQKLETYKRNDVKTTPSIDQQVVGPLPRAADPYGSWTVVDNTPVEAVDLQLPEQRYPAPPVCAPVIEARPETKFKEKLMTFTEEDSDNVAFKKRKINNFKRNTRQRLDDD